MTIKEVTMEQANQLMYDAIKRWQRAMKAVLAYNNEDTPFEERKKLWAELLHADDDLMDI